jgi:prepilin-type N-terminal cleavage/methylation domain-containing protein
MKQQGYTLVEVLIALSLASLIAWGLATFYCYYRAVYDYQKAMMEMTDNGVLASHFIRMLLDTAGDSGCLSLNNRIVNDHIHHDEKRFLSWAMLSPDEIHQNIDKPIQKNTAVLAFNFMDSYRNQLISDMTSIHTLILNEKPSFKVGDILMISNCERADIFSVQDVYIKNHQQIINVNGNLPRYHQFDEVSKWMQVIIYIANTDRQDSLQQSIPALYMQLNHEPVEEVVEGVSDLRILIPKKNQGDTQSVDAFSLRGLASAPAISKRKRISVSVTTTNITPVVINTKNTPLKNHLYHTWQFNDDVL